MKVSGFYKYEESVMISEVAAILLLCGWLRRSANLGMWGIKIT